MMLSKQLALSALALLGFANADDSLWTTISAHSGEAEYWNCDNVIRTQLVWDYTAIGSTDYAVYYDAQCDYPPAIGTLMLCAAYLAKNDTSIMDKVFERASIACGAYTDYPHPAEFFEEQYLNATKYYVPNDRIVNASLPIDFPTLPYDDDGDLEDRLLGYQSYYFNLDSGTWFSVGICGYFLLVLIIGSIYNFIRVSGLIKSVNNSSISKLIQKHIVLPTFAPNGKFNQYYGWKWASVLFPNRIEFLVDLFLFAFQIAFYSVPYRQHQGNFYDADPETLWQEYVSDRAGIMAFGKIPLLVLFAGRNNFLMYVTGWSHSTFLHFHKVLALWMTLDTLIHSVGYTIMLQGEYVIDAKDFYFQCGIAGTVLCFLLCGFAIHTIRNHYYQWFLLFHVIFAIVFIVMCWYHCNTLGWCEWLVAACAVWFFDRLVRVFRMIAVGGKKATITVVDDDLVKVEMDKPSTYPTKAGHYAYLYFGGITFWENHPFTIVCKNGKLTAYIRVKKGITADLHKKALAQGGSLERTIFIEGPYNTPGEGGIRKMDDLLLIAGGSGAPAILDTAASTSKGKLIWVSQKLSNVRAYGDLLKSISIETDIYITKEQGTDGPVSLSDLLSNSMSSDTNSSDEGKSQDIEKAKIPGSVNIIYGRPNMGAVIDEYISQSTETNVGVDICGPPAMSDEIRNIVANNVTKWDKSVNFFDELQVW